MRVLNDHRGYANGNVNLSIEDARVLVRMLSDLRSVRAVEEYGEVAVKLTEDITALCSLLEQLLEGNEQ